MKFNKRKEHVLFKTQFASKSQVLSEQQEKELVERILSIVKSLTYKDLQRIVYFNHTLKRIKPRRERIQGKADSLQILSSRKTPVNRKCLLTTRRKPKWDWQCLLCQASLFSVWIQCTAWDELVHKDYLWANGVYVKFAGCHNLRCHFLLLFLLGILLWNTIGVSFRPRVGAKI